MLEARFFCYLYCFKYEYTYPPFILHSVSFRNSHSSNPSLPCIVYKVPSGVTFKLYLIDFIKPFQTAHCFSELAEVFQLVCSGVRGCMGSAAKVFYYGSLFSLNYYWSQWNSLHRYIEFNIYFVWISVSITKTKFTTLLSNIKTHETLQSLYCLRKNKHKRLPKLFWNDEINPKSWKFVAEIWHEICSSAPQFLQGKISVEQPF